MIIDGPFLIMVGDLVIFRMWDNPYFMELRPVTYWGFSPVILACSLDDLSVGSNAWCSGFSKVYKNDSLGISKAGLWQWSIVVLIQLQRFDACCI